MGLPRLDDECREAMGEVSFEAQHIRDALAEVDRLVNSDTWTGPPAERWSADCKARMQAIKGLLDSLPAEEQRLEQKARQDQAQLDRQRRAQAGAPTP